MDKHQSPKIETPCCGFAELERMGDAIAEGMKLYRRDDGTMVCARCIAAFLTLAEDKLRNQRRQDRRQRLGFQHYDPGLGWQAGL